MGLTDLEQREHDWLVDLERARGEGQLEPGQQARLDDLRAQVEPLPDDGDPADEESGEPAAPRKRAKAS